MIRSTPHPPDIPVTKSTHFGVNIGDQNLFSVQPGIKAEDALTLVSEDLYCAATVYESADNCSAEFRP